MLTQLGVNFHTHRELNFIQLMSNNKITIKTASLVEIELLLQWASDEGWNPGIADATLFRNADPDGFFMLYDDDAPAAGISVIKQGANHGFLGLYLCHPDYRGKGFGWKVWQAGMNYLDDRVIGLDGVVEQQSNYQKSGFELVYRNIRFQGATTSLLLEQGNAMGASGAATVCEPMAKSDWAEVLAMDAHVHGHARERLLSAWLTDEPSRQSFVCKFDGSVHGFGTIRQCQTGFKIGPLIGSNAGIARELLKTMTAQTNAKEIIVDVPEPNHAAIELMNNISLQPVFETARMYRGERPDSTLAALFGVTSFELG